MNGPEAMAGSMFNLLMKIGITAPTTVDRLKVINNENPIINANIQF